MTNMRYVQLLLQQSQKSVHFPHKKCKKLRHFKVLGQFTTKWWSLTFCKSMPHSLSGTILCPWMRLTLDETDGESWEMVNFSFRLQDVDSVTVSLFVFFLICQIVRRLPQPSESGCRIFDGPELKNMCLKEPFFGGLALPHIWNQYWEGFWGHRYITEELGGAFLSLYPTPVASNVWEAVFVQFWLQLDLFWKPDIFLLPLISAQSSFNTSVDTI